MSNFLSATQLRDDFARRIGRPPAVVTRAPGRVNLIGEHTDYNEGFVLPMALEQCTWVAAAPRTDDQLRVFADALRAEARWPLAEWQPGAYPDWTAYVAGVALLLRRSGSPVPGADLVIRSDVPVGSGLSSSAALEVSSALALSRLAGTPLEGRPLADLCRAAEHEYAHVPCGIMDQYVSVLARGGHAFLLDCRSRTWDFIPLALGEHVVLIVNSGVRHKLAAGEYAVRQQQCQEAVAYFRNLDPAVRALRDVSAAQVAEHADRMRPIVAARARHVTTEDERTLAAAAALRRDCLADLGPLLRASHNSLRDDYQVSIRELDLLVELVSGVPGVIGARMTGGGFGGCMVALVHADSVSAIRTLLRDKYDGAGFGPSQVLFSRPGPGAGVVD